MLQWTCECRYLFQFLLVSLKKKYPEVGLPDPIVVLFLLFWGTSLCFSLVAVPIYVPTNRTQVFSFLYILPNTYCFCLFEESHSDRCEVAPHYGLDLHVTGGEWWWVPFHIPTGHLHVFSGKMSVHILCRFFNQIFLVVFFFFFLAVELYELFIYFDY